MNRIILVTAFVCSSLACTSSDQRSTSGNAAGNSATGRGQGQRVVGHAYLVAPIKNAHIRVTRLAQGVRDEVIADDHTGDDGDFDITLPQPTDGDLLIEVLGDRGGTTIEPITSVSPITLSESDRLMALAIGTQLGGETAVIITPMSTLVAARAIAQFRGGARLSDAYAKNTDLFSAHFQTSTFWLSPPVDILTAAAPGLASGVIYSLVAVGLSKHALELGERASVSDVSIVNSLVVLRALVADISSATDIVFDGKRDGSPLNIIGNVFIDQETTRLGLAKSIESFLDSSANKTGLTSRDASRILTAIRLDVSELYPNATPPQDTPDTGKSGAPPVIVVTAPTANQTFGTNDYIVGYAEDADGIASLKVSLDGSAVSAQQDTSVATKWTFSFEPSLSSGPHLLEVEAADARGNVAKKQVQFSYDSQAPLIAIVDCTSPDDRDRATSVSLSGATYSDSTTMFPCAEAELQSGDQAVFTFADLYEEGTRITKIRLSVTDQSQLASVSYRVKTNGMEVTTLRALKATGAPATHVIELSADALARQATEIHSLDMTTVEVVAIDQNGNKVTREFAFHLNLIPTPLDISQTAADSATSLQGNTFALGIVHRIFDSSLVYDPNKTCGNYYCHVNEIPFLQLTRFVITNVSSRPITLSRDWLASSDGAMTLKRWLYRGYYFSNQAFARNPNSPCPEITDVAMSGNFNASSGFQPATADYSTQTCLSLANDLLVGKRAQDLTYTPEWRVYELPSNVEKTDAAITLAPGKQYAVVLGVTHLATPVGLPDLSYGWPYDAYGSVWNNVMYNRDTTTRYPLTWGETESPTNVAGFFRFNRFVVHSNGSTHRLWGGASGHYASDSYNGISPSGRRLRSIYVPATGMNHLVSPIVLERGIELAGNLKWRVPVSMSLGDMGFVGTPNHQPKATFAPYFDQPSGVTLCPWANPLCNVDLSGW